MQICIFHFKTAHFVLVMYTSANPGRPKYIEPYRAFLLNIIQVCTLEVYTIEIPSDKMITLLPQENVKCHSLPLLITPLVLTKRVQSKASTVQFFWVGGLNNQFTD